MRRLATLLFLLGVAWPTSAQTYECFEAFCVDGRVSGDSIAVYLENRRPGSLTFRLNMELDNLTPSEPLPLIAPVRGGESRHVLDLAVRDTARTWWYRFDVEWVPGYAGAEHDEAQIYQLPFSRGEQFRVGQGYDTGPTHQGMNALDFDLPEGAYVRAVRDGVVVETQDTFMEGGDDPDLRSSANLVKVEHADGSTASYVHLKWSGVRVEVGQRVRRGDLLGISGNTGYSSGPHLHLEIYVLGEDLKRQTLRTRFRTSDGVRELREGRMYGH